MDDTPKKLAELQDQVDTLKGQTLALYAVLGQLTHALANSSPEALAVVRLAFDEAASQAELVAIAFGERASPKETVEALRRVEELRRAALRDHEQ
jgi:hypothetical protein